MSLRRLSSGDKFWAAEAMTEVGFYWFELEQSSEIAEYRFVRMPMKGAKN